MLSPAHGLWESARNVEVGAVLGVWQQWWLLQLDISFFPTPTGEFAAFTAFGLCHFFYCIERLHFWGALFAPKKCQFKRRGRKTVYSELPFTIVTPWYIYIWRDQRVRCWGSFPAYSTCLLIYTYVYMCIYIYSIYVYIYIYKETKRLALLSVISRVFKIYMIKETKQFVLLRVISRLLNVWTSVCMYMNVHTCTYIYLYTYTYTWIYAYTKRIQRFVWLRIIPHAFNMYMNVHACIYTFVHIYTYTNIYTYKCVCIHT